MKAGEFVMKMFHARTSAHTLHLRSRSYSQHMALFTFYDEIVELTDTYAEVYQGQYGLIAAYPPKYTVYENPEVMLQDVLDYIAEERSEYDLYAKEDTHLSNIVDEIVALTSQTLYKIRNLK